MRHLSCLPVVLFVSFVVLSAAAGLAADAKQPNVIVILADDM